MEWNGALCLMAVPQFSVPIDEKKIHLRLDYLSDKPIVYIGMVEYRIKRHRMRNQCRNYYQLYLS